VNEDKTLCCVHHRGMHDQGGRCTIADCQCKWGSVEANPRYLMTAAQVSEPTSGQLARGYEFVHRYIENDYYRDRTAKAFAASLAAERAAIHARYEALGVRLAAEAGLHGVLREIRQVAAE